eukprot:3530526-Pyramimonas_sp.AAC.1
MGSKAMNSPNPAVCAPGLLRMHGLVMMRNISVGKLQHGANLRLFIFHKCLRVSKKSSWPRNNS